MAAKTADRNFLQGQSVDLFRAAIKSQATRDPYERRLIGFLKRMDAESPVAFAEFAKNNPITAERKIIAFLSSERARAEQGEISAGTINNWVKAARLFLEMSDVQLNWKKIRRVLPRARRYALDRVPTIDELREIFEAADLKQAVNIIKFNDYSWGCYDIENNYSGKVGYIKDSKIRGRVTIFTTGKMISKGAKSIIQSAQQLYRALELLARNGFVKRVRLQSLVRNIVATFNIETKIDLIRAATEIPKSIYEPNQFPGIIHWTSSGPVCLIFASGRIVIVDIRSESQLHTTANHLFEVLMQFKLE